MSSGEEFEVDEILQERRRKGVVEYLVRWKGFNSLYDSWEPATGLADCTRALKAWVTQTKRSKSKSRSRSRGRSKSRSRSRSRGRTPKSETTSKRSRSRSSGRKVTKSSSKTTVAKVESSPAEQSKIAVVKIKSSPAEQSKSIKLLSGAPEVEEKVSASTSRSETVVEKTSSKATSSTEGQVVQQKTEVVKRTVETVKAAPVGRSETSSGMTTRSRAVRQVQNDQNPAPKAAESQADKKATWLWWFADHAVLVLFIVVSLIALSFTIESISGVRDKLVPDLGVLRQRLGESYDHFVQGVSAACSHVADAVAHGWGHVTAAVFPNAAQEAPAAQAPTAPPPKQTAA